MSRRPLLILGGTRLAFRLAQDLACHPRWQPLTSLAGRTDHPRLPPGDVRIGGFGGAAGLKQHLQAHRIAAVIDATHRFAWQISRHAKQACREAGDIPYLRLVAPRWQEHRQRGRGWQRVTSERDAARRLAQAGSWRRAFLALGYQHLGAFLRLPRRRLLVRTLNRGVQIAGVRRLIGGPESPAKEISLMKRERIDVLVVRNSGGSAGWGKMLAAKRLSIPVILIDPPQAHPFAPARHPEAAVRWLESLPSGSEKGR